ncbi:MAG: hypothetical protein JW994_03885, partial [Candidatus Omnitrophica bacterium]|nr:hypothetical protein [Candidatus Omnitrophota bacterium]
MIILFFSIIVESVPENLILPHELCSYTGPVLYKNPGTGICYITGNPMPFCYYINYVTTLPELKPVKMGDSERVRQSRSDTF